MASTTILIDCDDFDVLCPNCGVVIEEINIRRLWNPIQECPECFCEYELMIDVESA